MQEIEKAKLMLLMEETVVAVRGTLKAFDAILEKACVSATGEDDKALRDWTIRAGRANRAYMKAIHSKHAVLLMLLDTIKLKSEPRDEIRARLYKTIEELATINEEGVTYE